MKWMRHVTLSHGLWQTSCEYGSYTASNSWYRDFTEEVPLTACCCKITWEPSTSTSSWLSFAGSNHAAIFPIPPRYPLFWRLEDHSWRADPVGKEAVRRHDPHRFLPQRLCPHWPAALYGQPEAEVCAFSNQRQRHQQHQQHRRRCERLPAGSQLHSCAQHHVQLDRVHQRWAYVKQGSRLMSGLTRVKLAPWVRLWLCHMHGGSGVGGGLAGGGGGAPAAAVIRSDRNGWKHRLCSLTRARRRTQQMLQIIGATTKPS